MPSAGRFFETLQMNIYASPPTEELLEFLEDDEAAESQSNCNNWKVLVVDDDAQGKRRPTPVLTPQTFSLSRLSFTADKSKRPGSKSSPHHARIS